MKRAKVCGGGRAESGRYMPWFVHVCTDCVGYKWAWIVMGTAVNFFLGAKVLLVIALVHLLRDFGAWLDFFNRIGVRSPTVIHTSFLLGMKQTFIKLIKHVKLCFLDFVFFNPFPDFSLAGNHGGGIAPPAEAWLARMLKRQKLLEQKAGKRLPNYII